jgi:hypothetical protein
LRLGRTVAELQDTMSGEEFSQWAAYDLISPIGDERGDWQAAVVASVIAETNRDSRKRPRAFQPKDFLLEWGPPEKQDWRAIRKRALAQLTGHKVKGK